MKVTNRTRIGFLVILTLLSMTSIADAQRWGRRRAWERNGTQTRAAFTDTVREVRKSTVRVEVAGRLVALGTVVHSQGWILTKASLAPATCECVLADGRRLAATRRAVIQEHDLALLSVTADDLPAITWADAQREPDVGRWIAVPSHRAAPISVGVVSVPSRKIDPERGFLGVEIVDGDGNGARIQAVIDDTPAQRAGLRANDIVTAANDDPVKNRTQLVMRIRQVGAGGALKLRVQRGEKEVTLNAVIGQRNFDPDDIENSGRVSLRHSGFPKAFQHDAIVQPEQCGGPLVDLSGKAVGINIARANRAASLGIPAQVVREVVQRELKKLTKLVFH